MLAYFVNIHLDANTMTPTYILLLFIVSVLALAWSVFTLFSYHRSSRNAQFVALIDLAFVGALIAGVYYLRFIARADCASVQPGSSVYLDFGILGSANVVTGWSISVSKTCGMLKGCFALGIMNTVFFFVTAVLAWIHGDHAVKEERRYVESRRSHSRHRSRSGHRSHSGHRGGGSRRSSHSHHRAYV
jgi:predicted membrane-bound spermidine synthase